MEVRVYVSSFRAIFMDIIMSHHHHENDFYGSKIAL